ncbi:MAG: T9SS type A sorting domain-containing protein [Ignavibacteria bacterium]|nr:T9SS type A sorting domain-containing protein [Ignavibacteria bacterium]
MAVNPIPSMEELPVISSRSPGTVIAKVRLQTSVKSFAEVPLDLKLRTGPEDPYTKVSTLEDGKIKEITIVGTSAANEKSLSGGKESGSVIPKEYALLQNYPNPFNPETSIKFDIPNLSDVKLSVYDITGREVSVLVNEKLEPGSYSYKWNGAQFASGIYFFRVQAGSFIQTRKMALIK